MRISSETISLIGSVMVFTVFGSLQFWGNSAVYIVSRFHKFDNSLNVTKCTIAIPFCFLMQFVAAALSASYFPKKPCSDRIFSLIMIALMAAATYLSSLTESFYIFALCLSLAYVAVGLNFMTPFHCGWRKFPHKRGRITALIVFGYSLGPVLFNFLITMTSNPSNLPTRPFHSSAKWTENYYGDAMLSKVPFSLQIVAAVQFFVGVIGTILMTLPRSRPTLSNLLLENEIEQEIFFVPGEIQPDFEAVELFSQEVKLTSSLRDNHLRILEDSPLGNGSKYKSLNDVLTTNEFWKLFAIAVTSTVYSSSIVLFYKDFGQENHHGDHFLTYLGCCSYLANGFWKGYWAWSIEKMGFSRFGSMVHCTNLILGILMPFSFVNESHALYSVWILLTFVTMGATSAWIVQGAVKFFGQKYGSIVAVVMNFGTILSYLIVALSSFLLLEVVGYDNLLRLYAFGLLISLGLSFTL